MKKNLSHLVKAALFTFALFTITSQESYKIKVSSPNGAPGIALATLAVQNPQDYTYVAAEAISAEFASNKSDFIIAPVNAGAKLYKMKKSSYKLAAVVTWGNLYFASQRKNFKLKDIKKSELVLFGENTINSSVALYALEKNGIKPKSVRYLASAAATQNLLLTDKNAIVLTAEPVISAAKIKNAGVSSYSLLETFKKATGYDGYTQAGLFVREESIKNHESEIKDFLSKAKVSCEAISNDLPSVVKACVELKILPNAKIAENAIPNCGIKFVKATEGRKQLEYTAKIDIKQFGDELPQDDFYYEY